jgi:hypothetical protein
VIQLCIELHLIADRDYVLSLPMVCIILAREVEVIFNHYYSINRLPEVAVKEDQYWLRRVDSLLFQQRQMNSGPLGLIHRVVI